MHILYSVAKIYKLFFSSLNGHVNGTGVSHAVAGAPLDAETVSWIVALPPLLAILGSVSSSVFLNFLGRRNSIILSGFILTASFSMIYLADFMETPQVRRSSKSSQVITK